MTQPLADFKFISSDSHVNEPPELFGERMPARLRPRAPRMEIIDEVPHLLVEGLRPRRMPRGREALEGEALERPQAGGWDPKARMRDQDRDGIAAEVVYPTLSLQSSFATPDPELQLALARAYNEGATETFAPHPERFAVAAIVPIRCSTSTGRCARRATRASSGCGACPRRCRRHRGRGRSSRRCRAS